MTTRFRRIGLGIGAAVVAVGLAVAVGVSAQQNTTPAPGPFPGPGGPGMRGPMMRGPMMMEPFGQLRMLERQLDLTDAQKDQVRTILQSRRTEWKALADRRFAAQQALVAAETADTLDDATIREQSAGVAAVEADMAVARAHARAEIFQVLTPDQRAKAKELQSQMQQRFQQQRERRDQGGPGGQSGAGR